MNQLQLTLLGTFTVIQNRQPITAFDSNKVRALLAYLAVERTNHTRDFLAALLWPDHTEVSARTNLRQALYQLRRTIGDESAVPPVLLVSRQTIGLNSVADVVVDVTQFRHLLAEVASHSHEQLLVCERCRQQLDQAQQLYQADFLNGLAVDESAQFEEWRRMTQEQLHLQMIDTLQQLAMIAMQQDDLAALLRYADRQLALEPLREEAHRQRMWALAQSGQRAAAIEQYHLCRQRLAAELGIEPDVKTVALYDQLRQHQFAPTVTTPPTAPHAPLPSPTGAHLPMQLTPFIGREREVAELVALLRNTQTRLITLVGPGGMGKTRLAIESARRALDEAAQESEPSRPLLFPDGVFFVSLAALQAARALAPAIAAALALPLTGPDPETVLLAYLRPRRLLLILDNFEHLLDSVPFVITVLQQAPTVQLLVTARERLNLPGEQLYYVHEMDYTAQSTLATAANASAVRLFVDRAQRVQPAFQLRAENLAAVLRICRLVQGMPLGLELAAAWVELLSLTEIIAEIEKSADFLAVDWQSVPDRQRSMRAVFTWSWQLLTAEEQQVFCQLALFRGGFTREAALAVAGASLHSLAALVRKSLVRRVEGAAPGALRYEIHELLRQFAAEALAERPTVQQRVEAQYSSYFLDFVAARGPRFHTHDARAAAAELQADIDNIRLAWQLAARRQWLTALEKSVVALREFIVFAGLMREGATLLEEAINALGQQPQGQPPMTAVDATAHLAKERLLSTLLGFHGSFLISLGEHTAAQADGEAAYQLGQHAGALLGEMLGALVRGQAHRRLGNSQEAQRWLWQTVALAQQQRHLPLYRDVLSDVERRADSWLCSIALTQDDYLAAQRYAQAGLAICRSTGRVTGEIACLTDLFDIARIVGDYATARRECERALQLARQVGFRWGEAGALWGLGDTLRLSGEYAEAANLYEAARHHFRAMGQFPTECEILSDQGRLQLYCGNYAAAEQFLMAADTILQTLHYPAWETFRWFMPQALLAHATGHVQQALTYAERATQMARELYGKAQQADALVVLGLVMEGHAAPSATIEVYQQALVHYTTVGLHHKATEPQAALARLALQQGSSTTASEHAAALLQALDKQLPVGYDEPFRVYLSCYRVLAAHDDSNASTVLTKGYTLLQRYAERLPAAAFETFWEAVPTHRDLAAAHAAHTAGD